jgi:hypothetical protein
MIELDPVRLETSEVILLTDGIHFEGVKASQSDGGGFSKLSLFMKVKSSLMVM